MFSRVFIKIKVRMAEMRGMLSAQTIGQTCLWLASQAGHHFVGLHPSPAGSVLTLGGGREC